MDIPIWIHLTLGSGALSMHLLYMIMRFLSPLSGLSTNPNPWSFSSLMVYFIVMLCQGWDRRPLCILMDTIILEGISCGISIRPTLWEFMSLLLQNFHVHLWSCMEDVVLHNVLRPLLMNQLINVILRMGENCRGECPRLGSVDKWQVDGWEVGWLLSI